MITMIILIIECYQVPFIINVTSSYAVTRSLHIKDN